MEANEKTTILMVGNKGSGKTTYMSSSYGVLKGGIYGFQITADSDSDAWLSKIYAEINAGRYPSLTLKRGKYDFDLLYQGQKVHAFEWIDYQGGVINESYSEDLADDIEKAEAVMIFMEAEALLHNQKKVTQLRRILALLSEKLIMETRCFNVIILITKYDEIGGEASLKEVCKPLMNFKESIENKGNIYFRIIPVSCTKEGLYNVDLPLLDVLHSGLAIRYLSAFNQCNKNIEQSRAYDSKSGLTDWFVSRILGTPTYGDLAKSKRRSAIDEWRKMEALRPSLEKLGEFIDGYQIVLPAEKKAAAQNHGKRERRNRFRL